MHPEESSPGSRIPPAAERAPSQRAAQASSAAIERLASVDALLGVDSSMIRVWRRRLGAVDARVPAASVRPGAEASGRSEGPPADRPSASQPTVAASSPEPPSRTGPPPGRTAPIAGSEARRAASAPDRSASGGAVVGAAAALDHGSARADAATPGEGGERATRLEALRREHDAACPHCTIATAHTRTVFGEGNPLAAIMFIGEAPGETEDRLGRPFVGRAGEKLDQIIAAMGLSRADVYIANVLKSRPPENRTPLRHEIEGCGPFLRRQIEIIRPRAIVTLGGPATQLLLGVEVGITRLRGIWAEYALEVSAAGGSAETLVVPVMPTFHPAYLLRNYTPQVRRQVWEDMQKVLERLGLPGAG